MNRNTQTTASTAILVSKREARNLTSLATFPPGYFALVMATGIVSLAAHDQGWERAAKTLFWLNIAAYLVLWLLTLLRFIRHRKRVLADLTHHSHSAAFLTIVAGTCV